MTTETVSYSRADGMATLLIDAPPRNALSHALRVGLAGALDRFEADPEARIAVLVGRGPVFCAGADVREFGRPRKEPQAPDLINRLAALEKPTLAVLHGAALGGGLELALAAHYRLAMPGATLGLPEVNLGLIPGAGGTQRLPRLVGFERAIDVIAEGATLTAEEALAAGLVDAVGSGDDPLAAGLAEARRLLSRGAPSRRIDTLPAPAAAPGLFEAARARMAGRYRHDIARQRAIDAIETAARKDAAAGLAEERRLFLDLVGSPQQAALTHAFFAARRASRLPELDGIAPRPVRLVGVIGGGTMGAGIATAALQGGFEVVLVERDAAAMDRARRTVTGNLDRLVAKGTLTPDGLARLLDKGFRTVLHHSALAEADLVIEAVFEDMDLKKTVFAELAASCRPGAILATNTSYLDVDEIAGVTGREGEVIGLHFFSPAHVMKLLEVVVGARTAPDVVATAFALAARLDKIAVRAGVCDGFIGNRMLSHYRGAADHMVLDGAHPYQIDAALERFGFAMGPYAVGDLAGIDLGYMARRRKGAPAVAPHRYPHHADLLYGRGWYGQKTGRGYYLYDERRNRSANPGLEEVLDAARHSAGTTARSYSDDEIVARYLAAMINEGARVIGEGIARRPLDVDVVKLHGYGFPRWRGGPMHHADSLGLAGVLQDIRRFAAGDEAFWRPAGLLEDLVRTGRRFADLNDTPGMKD